MEEATFSNFLFAQPQASAVCGGLGMERLGHPPINITSGTKCLSFCKQFGDSVQTPPPPPPSHLGCQMKKKNPSSQKSTSQAAAAA